MTMPAEDKPRKKGGRPAKSSEGTLTKTMAFRLRPALEKQLRESALREGRSMSEEVEARLNRSVQHEGALAEMFGSADQRELLLAVGNAVHHADSLSGEHGHDNIIQGYAAVIAIVQGLAGKRAAEILKRASENGIDWRDAATRVLGLVRGIGEDEACRLVDPIGNPAGPPDDAPSPGGVKSEEPFRRRSAGEIMGR